MTLDTIKTIVQDGADVLAAVGILSAAIAHLPFLPAAWAERFARFASFVSQRFSVNRRVP